MELDSRNPGVGLEEAREVLEAREMQGDALECSVATKLDVRLCDLTGPCDSSRSAEPDSMATLLLN